MTVRESFIKKWRRVWFSVCVDGRKALQQPETLDKWKRTWEAEDDAEAYLGKIFDEYIAPAMKPAANGQQTPVPARKG